MFFAAKEAVEKKAMEKGREAERRRILNLLERHGILELLDKQGVKLPPDVRNDLNGSGSRY